MRRHVELVLGRHRHEAGSTLQQRGPHAAGRVGRAQQQELSLGDELSGGVRDGAVNAAPDPLGVRDHAGPALHLELAFVILAHQKKPQDGAPATGDANPAAPVGL